MNSNHDDKLGALLREVDRAIAAPQLSRGLVERVRHAEAKRRVRRSGLMAAAALIGAGIGVATFASWNAPVVRPSPVASAADIAAMRTEIAQLRDEARVRVKLIELTRDERHMQQQIAKFETQLATPMPDPVLHAQIESEQAARTLVKQGDRLMDEMRRPEIARSRYEMVIRLYPHTASAAEARQQLEKIDQGPAL